MQGRNRLVVTGDDDIRSRLQTVNQCWQMFDEVWFPPRREALSNAGLRRILSP
jgi:hypothetical protein